MRLRFLSISFLLFLSYQSNFSQIQSGEISYRVETKSNENYQKNLDQIKDSKVKALVLKKLHEDDHLVPFLSYLLEFNKNRSVFKRRTSISNDSGLDLERTSESVGIKGHYYVDLPKGLRVHQHEFLGERWLLERSVDDLEWKIRDETREIKGYKTQKAVATVDLNDVKRGEITAWFASEIPFQFGPMAYAGLPGMILGLEIRHYYIYAKTIKLSKKEKTIPMPTQGRRVSWEEYNEETDKLLPWKNK